MTATFDEPTGERNNTRRRFLVATAGAMAGGLSGCSGLRRYVNPFAPAPGSDTPPPGQFGPPSESDLSLVFADSFTDDSLDPLKWRDKYPWDARTHNYDGFAAPENVYVSDDRLVLEADSRPQGGKSYSTGVVSARREFTPGYYEAAIKIPPMVQGFWPAFWLTSVSDHPPEIDIFEFSRGDPRAWMTYHYTGTSGEDQRIRAAYDGPDFSADFHVYSVDWSYPDRIVWYIDGVERFRYEGEFVTDHRMWLILNFGIAADRHRDPLPSDLPARYEVDWIRCWEY